MIDNKLIEDNKLTLELLKHRKEEILRELESHLSEEDLVNVKTLELINLGIYDIEKKFSQSTD